MKRLVAVLTMILGLAVNTFAYDFTTIANKTYTPAEATDLCIEVLLNRPGQEILWSVDTFPNTQELCKALGLSYIPSKTSFCWYDTVSRVVYLIVPLEWGSYMVFGIQPM